MPDGQQAGQDNVFDSTKSLSKANVELVLNQAYLPALANLRRSCYKGLGGQSMLTSASQFIGAWIDLDTLIRTNLSRSRDGELVAIESTLLNFLSEGGGRDYVGLMKAGMDYSLIIRDSGLHNLTLEEATL